LLTDAHSKAGHFAQARDTAEIGNREADALVKHDPTNRKWQATQGIARYWRARLASTGSPKSAVPIADEAERMLAAVHAAEPKDAQVNTWLERTHALQKELAQPAMAAAR
ncbi:MAG TPA: hypothetical protein VMS49_05520, partial [Lysobacter sp.]|nr:hypothetical protein [Lysobacter sp.]